MDMAGQPTYQGVKQGYRKKLVWPDSTRILEVIPDAAYLYLKGRSSAKDLTGHVFVYDENYHFLRGLVYHDGKAVGLIKPAAEVTNSVKNKSQMVYVSESCVWYESNYVDGEGVFTVYAEKVCDYTIYDDGYNPGGGSSSGGGYSGDPYGGGSGGAPSPAPEPETPPMAELPGQQNQKIEPKKFMDCFGSLPDVGSKMSVTFFVVEPQPGVPFNVGQNSVGHTAIGLTKTYGDQSITQVVGFYPDATGKDRVHAPSKMADNGGLDYNVSITYQVQAFEFNAILNAVANPPVTYDLYSYNCTNFAYDAGRAGGIKLPDPTVNVGMFQTGMSPGGLGNAIRNVADLNNTNTKGGTVGQTHGPCN